MTAAAKRGKRIVYAAAEIAGIREAARVTAVARQEIARLVQPGVTTLWLDQRADEIIRRYGGESAFRGYRGYPGQICISVNDEVVHGIGRADRVIQFGDLVSLDVGIRVNGFVGDTALTVCAGGEPTGLAQRLIDTVRQSLDDGMAAARAGRDVCEIGRAVERRVHAAGFSVVRDFVGHGVGRAVHEPPEVPNFALPPRGPLLEPGMVLAVEPMINAGSHRVKVDADGWTVRSADGSLSAHWEHMILITDGEPEILTCPRTPSESKA